MMVDILTKLNQIGKNHIDQSFGLYHKEAYVYVSDGGNISEAINHNKGDKQQVKVLNWFNEFWVYININFIPHSEKKEFPNIFFSMSVFQGEVSDNNKVQLFRAEWDNYEVLSDKHPQPHWHIYTNRDLEDISKEFKELIESESDSFGKYIESYKKVVNIERFYFAMNGQWSDNCTDVHKIETNNNLTDWFEGILNHVKKELEYIEVD